MIPPLLSNLLQDPYTPNYVIRDAIRDTVGEDGMVNVFMVFGHRGFSSKECWTVGGFLDEESATELSDKLNDWCKENKVHVSNVGPYMHPSGAISCRQTPIIMCGSVSPYPRNMTVSGYSPSIQFASGAIVCGSPSFGYNPYWTASGGPHGLKCPLDPDFKYDYNGVRYSVVKCPLRV